MKLKRINESIASEFVKKDKEETEAGVIEPVKKEGKVLEPVNDEVHVAAVDGLEQNKEAAKEVVEDSTITKNAEELVKEESKEKHESLNVKSRVELAKLISEAKKNNQTYKISKCLEEGYRYTFEITGTEKLAEDLEEEGGIVVDLSDEGEIIPAADEVQIAIDEEPKLETFEEQMDFLAADEQEAIDGYHKVLELVEDEHVKAQLEKILVEEEAHKAFLEAVKKDKALEYAHEEAKEEKKIDEFLDANVSVASGNSMDGNKMIDLPITAEVPIDAHDADVTVGGVDAALADSLEKDKVNKADEECKDKEDCDKEEKKKEEGLGSAITGLTKDIPVVNMLLADDENEKKDIKDEEELPAEDEEEVFAAEEEEIPVDDDFFGEDPEPVYDDEVEGEEKVLEVKPEEIKETEVLSKFGDFEPAEDVKEFWELVKESGKLDDLEFFLDEFDIDDNEKLAEFLADESHRDYLLSALGLGADLIPFEDDEPAPVDYDELEDEKGE